MSLSFDITWDPASRQLELGQGTLVVRVAGELVWGTPDAAGVHGVSWTWVDFLEHLARVWPRLLWQPMPFGFEPEAIGSFTALARERAAHLDPDDAAEHEQTAFDFAEAHDLAHGAPGIRLPSLWLLPEGKRVCVATQGRTRWLPERDAVAPLEAFCTAIADRLGGVHHPRARAATAAWRERRRTDEDPVELFTGWSADELAGLGAWLPPRARPVGLVTALARAVRGAMSPSDLKRVLQAVHAGEPVAPARVPPAFDGTLTGLPHEQGFALAQWLRAQLDAGDERVDPQDLLKALGTRIVRLRLSSSRNIDALAAWVDRRHPVVILNEVGAHSRSKAGQRASLAHELCHLLVDAQDSLPLAEAIGGPMPREVEQRARAFAAEFLAPRAAVASLHQGDAQATVKAAATRFGVSAEIAAWQLRNSGVALSNAERSRLKQLVSRPAGF